MPWNPDHYNNITWNTGLAARAQRDAAQYNLKLKKKRRPGPKAASSKRQAASPKNSHKNFFWPTIPTRRHEKDTIE